MYLIYFHNNYTYILSQYQTDVGNLLLPTSVLKVFFYIYFILKSVTKFSLQIISAQY